MEKINLKGCSHQELANFITDLNEKPFRVSQIWSWIYQKGLTDFDGMTNISQDFRSRLKQIAFISSLKLVDKKISPVSKTQKFLWELDKGLRIESVYIPEGKRRTICISSQVGCSLGCTFCATGSMGFVRNLEPHEIVDQVISIRREIGIQPTNIVVMGMGEPFLNYENVIKALVIINDNEGISIGHRKITVSTAGIIPQLYRYIDEAQPFKLAVSLNATTNEQRTNLMPINRRYPIEELINACRQYTHKHRKRLTFEYVLMKGLNNTSEDARRLLKLLKGIPCKINIIAYNPIKIPSSLRSRDSNKHRNKKYTSPDEKLVQTFAEQIRPLYAPVTLRLSRGRDINAACGQLVV